jgi:hypothetical protein
MGEPAAESLELTALLAGFVSKIVRLSAREEDRSRRKIKLSDADMLHGAFEPPPATAEMRRGGHQRDAIMNVFAVPVVF